MPSSFSRNDETKSDLLEQIDENGDVDPSMRSKWAYGDSGWWLWKDVDLHMVVGWKEDVVPRLIVVEEVAPVAGLRELGGWFL
ncbi:hypothetical protein LIER_32808 [Lithospermum erythrorhizon]|uniref:Uncharacterized protein n=1 Tax=Lithospermum erythrorhizon TaxID=34254 RepID=A0AAV3RY09_LITER